MELLKTCTVIYIIIQLTITISTTAPEESENSERVKSISPILEEDIEHVIGDGISGDIDPLGSVYHAEVEDKEKVGADESSNTENLRATPAPQTTTTTSTLTPSSLSTTTQSTPPNCVISSKLNQTDKIIRNEVKLVNGSHLTRTLSDSATLECFLVLFYVPWCPFSARLAPLFNALPKAFPNLDILAFDVSKSVGYNTKFGTSAVPMVLLFQHKNVLAKFNYTEKNLTEFIEFVSLKTGFKGNKSVEIDEEDLVGPVPTVAQQRFDYFLFISWIFLIIVSIDYSIRKTRLRVYLMRWLRRLALWIRDIRYPVNNANILPELDEPQRLQAIENAAINRHNENHPHFE